MALQTLTGGGMWMPTPIFAAMPPAFAVGTIDATGEKIALNGRVWFPARTGTKNLTRFGFRFGTVVKAGGSGLTVSAQDVALATGPPTQPDETQDQTVAIANGNASFATNTWIRTDALSANRTVTYGDLLSVVIEYDGGGRLGSDSVEIAGVQVSPAGMVGLYSPSIKTGGTWAALAYQPNVLLEFDDGTYGVLEGGFAFSDLNQLTPSVSTTPDEYCLEFQLPGPVEVDGLWAIVYCAASTADFEMILYDGTTAMHTPVTVDANSVVGTVDARWIRVPIPLVQLSANTTYRVAIRPTNTTIRVYYADVNDAAYWAAMEGGTTFVINSRTDQGAWGTATTTRRLFAGFRVSAIDDGVGGGGAALLSGGIITRPRCTAPGIAH